MSKVAKAKIIKDLANGGLKTPAVASAAATPLTPQVAVEGQASLKASKPARQTPPKDEPEETSASAEASAEPSAETTSAAASSPAAAVAESSPATPTATSGGSDTTFGKSFEGWTPAIDPQAFKSLMGIGGAILLSSLSSSGGGATLTPPPPLPGSGGNAIDGYLANALVWRDANDDQKWNPGEFYVFTDASGEFKNLTNGPGKLRLAGLTPELRALLSDAPPSDTIDISTGKTFTSVLSAPEGSTVITPLTTLVVATGNDPVKLSALKEALGIDPSIDLSQYDPLATLVSGNATPAQIESALKIQTASLKISNLIAMAATAVQSVDANFSLSDMVSSVAESLVEQASSNTGLNLDNSDALSATLQAAASGAGVSIDSATLTAAATAMSSVNAGMTESVNSAITNAAANPNGLSLNDALSVMTQAVASQLVVQESLLPAVAASASSGGTIAIDTSNFSGEALLDQVNAAKSSVETLVVAPPTQSLMVAVDDFGLINKAGAALWTPFSGNLVNNDLSGNAAKLILAAAQGASNNPVDLTPLSSQLTLTGVHGTLVVKADGSYTYTVTNSGLANQLVTDTFTYQVGSGNSNDLGTLTLSLDSRNDAPKVAVFQLALQSTGNNNTGSVNLLSGATDADGDALTVKEIKAQADSNFASTGPWAGQYGTLTLVNGVYQYQLDVANTAVNALADGATLRDVFLFGVTDGTATTQSALTVTITGAPIVVGSPVTLVDSNANNNTISENAASDTAVANLELSAADPDAGATVTLSLVGSANGLFELVGNEVRLALGKALDYETATRHTISVQAESSDGGVVTKNFTIEVLNVNEAPVITTGNTASVAENALISTVVYDAAATDEDTGSTLVYSLGGADAASFAINPSSGEVTLKAAANFEVKSTYSIDVIASDGALSASKAVTVTVTNVNDAPVITTGATASVAENALISTVVYDAAATDEDASNTLVYSLGGTDAASFDINASSGEVTLKAAANFEVKSTYNIDVIASDGALSATKAVTVTVTNVNDTPVIITGNTASVAENALISTVVYDAAATDEDASSTLVYSLGGADAASFVINPSNGEVTLKASANYEVQSSYSIDVIASDGALSASKAVTVTVTNVNEAPLLVKDSPIQFVLINGNTLEPISLADAFTDPEQDALTFSLTGTLPTGVSFDPGTASFSGKPTADGIYSLTVRVSDGQLATDQSYTLRVVSQPVVVSVSADKVVAKVGDPLTFTVTLSEPVTINTTLGTPVLVFDVAGNEMVAEYRAIFGSGTSTATTVLTFVSTATAGTDSQVTIKSLSLGNATVTGNLTGQSLNAQTSAPVDNLVVDNSAPVFDSGTSVTVAENIDTSTVVYTASASDDTALSYSLGGANSSAFNLLNGELTFKSRPDFETLSSYQFSITATDAAGNASTQNVTIGVTDVNEAPTAVTLINETASLPENTSTTSRVKVADIQVSDDALGVNTITLSGTDANLFEVVGQALYLKSGVVLNHEAVKNSYAVTVSVGDATVNGSAVTANYTLSVSDVNEAPIYTSGSLLDKNVQVGVPTSIVVPVDAFTDPDVGNTLSYVAYVDNVKIETQDWISFAGATQTFTLQPGAAQLGAHTLTVVASDGALSASGSFGLDVTVPQGQGILTSHIAQLTDYLDNPTTIGVDYTLANPSSVTGLFDSSSGLLNLGSAAIKVSRGNLLYISDGDPLTQGNAPLLSLAMGAAPVVSGVKSATLQIALTRGLDSVAIDESQVSVLLNVDMLNVGNQWVMRAAGTSVSPQNAMVQIRTSTISADLPFAFDGNDLIASTSGTGETLQLNVNAFALLTKLNNSPFGSLLGSFLNDGTYTLSIEQKSGDALPLLNRAGQALDGLSLTLSIDSSANNLTPFVDLGSDLKTIHLAMAPEQILSVGQFLQSGGGTDTDGGPRFALTDPENKLLKIWLLQPQSGTYGLQQSASEITWFAQDDYQILSEVRILSLNYGDLSKLVYQAPATLGGATTVPSLQLQFMLQDDQQSFSPLYQLGVQFDAALLTQNLVTEGSNAQTLLTLDASLEIQSLPTQGKLFYVRGDTRTEITAIDTPLSAGDRLEYEPPSVGGTQANAGQVLLRSFNNATDTYTYTTLDLQVNHLPSFVLTGTPETLIEDSETVSTAVTVTVSDIDTSNVLSWQSAGWAVNNGVLSKALTYGTATLSPDSGAVGQYTLSYALDPVRSQSLNTTPMNEDLTLVISDGLGGTSSRTVTFLVQGVNDPAAFAKLNDATPFDAVSITEGASAVSGRLVVSDIDSPSTVQAANSTGTYGQFGVAITGAWTYTPNGDLNALKAQTYTDAFTVTTADGTKKTVTVTIQGVNDAPVPGSFSRNVAINEIATFDVVQGSSDPEGDAFVATNAVLRQGSGLVSLVDGVVTFTPTTDFSGQVYIDYTLQDDSQARSSGVISLYVGNNTLPTGQSDTLLTQEDTSLVFSPSNFGFEDKDDGQSFFAVRIDSLPLVGVLQLNGVNVTAGQDIAAADIGKLSFVPAANASATGYASFTFTVKDSAGAYAATPSTLTIDVNAVNDAPVITSDASVSVQENTATSTVVYTATAEDIEDDDLTFSITGADAAKFTIDSGTGQIKFAAQPNFEDPGSATRSNTYSIQLVVDDGVDEVTKDLTITVTNVNEAPVIDSGATGTVAENAATSTEVYTATAVDVDANTTLVYSLDGTDKAFFNIDASTGVVTFKASANYEAAGRSPQYKINVIASDGALTDSEAVTITVTDVNEAPTAIAINGKVAIVENTADEVVVGTIALTDPDNNQSFPANVLTLAGADKDLFRIDGQQLVFKANPSVDYETRSSYSVTVVANAGTPLAASQAFTVDVSNVIDTLTLADNTIRVTDHDSSGLATTALVEAQSNDAGTLTLSLSGNDALNRVNLQKLLDGKPGTGVAPTIEFALQSTDQIATGTHPIHLELQLSNQRFNGLSVSVGVDFEVQLTRENDVLKLVMPTTPVDMVFKAGGATILTQTVQNLSPDTLSLVGGSNGIPNLSVKIDNLFDKAMDSTVAISELSGAGTLAIASGLVMGLLGGKSIGDLLALVKDGVTLPTGDVPAANLTQLIALVKDTVSLPADWQQLSFDQVLSASSKVLALPEALTFGDVLTLMRSTIELPPSLQGTLGSLKASLIDATDLQTVNQLESLARAMLGGTEASIADLSIPQLLNQLANSAIAKQSIQSLGQGAVNYFDGYNTISLFKDAARVTQALYGQKTLADVLVNAQTNITLPAELADLQALSLVGLLDLGALALSAQGLLGSNNLSINGLLNLVTSLVTVEGVVSPSRIDDLLALIDNSFDLQPLLGTGVRLSDLISNIGEPTLQIHPLLQIAAQTFLSSNGQIQATVDLPTMGLTDATGQLIQHIVVQAPIASIDQLTLSSAYVSVLDVNSTNQATTFSVLGQQSNNTLTVDLSAAATGTGLNRSNLLQLFDGQPQTGTSPVLRFDLKDTHDVPLGLSTVGVQFSIHNDRLASLTMSAAFDVQIELVRDAQGQLQMKLPTQTVQLDLSAAGMPVASLQVSNLTADMFELVSGPNGTPSLSLKIDSLIDKALGNTLPLDALSDQGTLTLAAGLVMGLVGGKSVGELLTLLQDTVNLSGDLPASSITRLLQLVQDTVTLPPELQNLSIGQLLSAAVSAFNLDSSLTVGQLIGVLQDSFVLPQQFNTLTLADLQNQLPDSPSSTNALNHLKAVALAMLQEANPQAQLSDVSPLTLSGLLGSIAQSTQANQSLDSLGTLVNAQISGYSGVDLIKDLAIVVNSLYGNKSALQVLQLVQEGASLPAALAGLEAISLSGLLDLSGLALAAADLLGPENLSIAGLTQLIYSAVTLDGQLNPSQINQALDTLDAALNLEPLLGTDYSLRALFSDLGNPQIELQPLINIASKVLLSSDGQASVQIDLPASLGLQGTTGQDIQRIVVNVDLSDTPNTAGQFALDGVLSSADAQFDLGQWLATHYTDPQGDALGQVLIDQPWVGDLLLAVNDGQQTTYTELFQNGDTVAQVSLAQLSQLVFVAPTAPDGKVLDLGVELQLRAVDTLGAIAEQQQLQLAFGNYPFSGI